MEIGIDSFAAVDTTKGPPSSQERVKSILELIERIVYADKVGINYFGIGEHHREEFLDSAPHMIFSCCCCQKQKE